MFIKKKYCIYEIYIIHNLRKKINEDDILNVAFVRQQYINKDGEDSKWMAASLIPLCDCDLTTYTGPTCAEGNETCISLYLVGTNEMR